MSAPPCSMIPVTCAEFPISSETATSGSEARRRFSHPGARYSDTVMLAAMRRVSRPSDRTAAVPRRRSRMPSSTASLHWTTASPLTVRRALPVDRSKAPN